MGRRWEKFECHFILFVIPVIFGFQMVILFPKLVQIVEAGPIQQYVHMFLGSLLLMNICGNMIMATEMNSNVVKEALSGDIFYCEYCKKWRSTDCLHCKKCNMCILRRDHHCGVLAQCVGWHNRRYYILYLGHVAIAMIYATFYNYCLLIPKNDEDLGVMIHIARILNPAVFFIIPDPVGKKDIYTAYILMNVGIGLWCGYLFCYHMMNTAYGVTAYEDKFKPELRNLKRWKENLLDVFGERWYLAMVLPFCSSRIPEKIKVE